MTFKQYQKQAIKTLIDNEQRPELLLARLCLGLCGESGEIAEKIKKYLRDTKQSPKDRIDLNAKISKEFGDLCWYLGVISEILNLDMNKILEENIQKLEDRQKRNKIKGEGDNR